MPVQYCFKHVWNILRLSLVSSSSSGLRLRRWSTTESGRRTGEPKTGPRVQRARRQPRLRRRPARLQRPRVLVRTPERNFTLKCTNPIFLFSSHRVVEVTLSTLLPLFDACSVSPVCCAAFYGLSSKTMKPNPSERKTRRKSRMSEWVPAVAVTAVVPGCSCRPLLDFLWQPFLQLSKYSLHHLVFKRSLQNKLNLLSSISVLITVLWLWVDCFAFFFFNMGRFDVCWDFLLHMFKDLCSSPSSAFGWFYRYEGKLPSMRKVLSAAWLQCGAVEFLVFNWFL